MTEQVVIRAGRHSDLATLVAIYNHYVAPDHTGSGIGSKLCETLFAALAEEPDAERLVAGITLPNEASVALQQKFGFETVGIFHRASDRRGEFYDLCWFDRSARLTTL